MTGEPYDYHDCGFNQYAQRVLKNPKFFVWKFERVHGGVLLTGAECPLKRNGQPNIRKHDRNTKMTIVYPVKEKE